MQLGGEVSIYCNTQCQERLSCQKFSRALDVNSGKIKLYYIIEKCEYEK